MEVQSRKTATEKVVGTEELNMSSVLLLNCEDSLDVQPVRDLYGTGQTKPKK